MKGNWGEFGLILALLIIIKVLKWFTLKKYFFLTNWVSINVNPSHFKTTIQNFLLVSHPCQDLHRKYSESQSGLAVPIQFYLISHGQYFYPFVSVLFGLLHMTMGVARHPDPLLGKIFEIDHENPLHRKKSLKLTTGQTRV
jgi:hypothetical protein